ncbi:GntR family transcriptional regulator [Halotalea alkalilenta]|nr:GntR family transcriptional regulator [Halotalea alkalilenta]
MSEPQPASDEIAKTLRIRATSLHAQVSERLRVMIGSGELAAGEKIQERALCELLGVSRTPLREALKALANEGLIELLPNRGSRVAVFTRQQLQEAFAVMAALEGLAGEEACESADETEIVEIEALHQELLEYYREGNAGDYFAINRAIHERIVLVSHNETLIEVYRGLNHRVRAMRFAMRMDPQQWREAIEEHESILRHLKRRDGRELGALLRYHLRNKLRDAPA